MMLQSNPHSTPSYGTAQQPREAPHNIEAEQALLGAILVNSDVLDRVPDLQPGHFYDQLHATIFETVRAYIAAGKRATPVTMRTFFENAEPLSRDMTVPQYLGRLAANATTIINVKDYARTIHDLAVRRQLILIGEELVNGALDAAIDIAPKDLIEEAEGMLFALAETGKDSRVVSMQDAVARAVESANAAHMRKGSGGLATGLADLDAMLGGLIDSDLIILAGRPAMGKSALALNIATNVAKAGREVMSDVGEITRVPAPVHFFSLEMSAEQMAARQLAAEAEVSSHDVRAGRLTQTQISEYIRHAQNVANLSMKIDESGGIPIALLAARARRAKRQFGTALIVIDYLQLLYGNSRKSENRVQEITQITTGLKALAKELNVPILALSQLSRGVEGRDNKRPQLNDLRESGSIEQDADVVMFVYREEYYVEKQKPDETNYEKYGEWQQKLAACRGKAEVVIGKHRHGPVGTVDLAFEGRFTRFGNLARTNGGAS